MSWYQEVVDMYSLYQIAIQEYDGSANPVVMKNIQYASHALQLAMNFCWLQEKYRVVVLCDCIHTTHNSPYNSRSSHNH